MNGISLIEKGDSRVGFVKKNDKTENYSYYLPLKIRIGCPENEADEIIYAFNSRLADFIMKYIRDEVDINHFSFDMEWEITKKMETRALI